MLRIQFYEKAADGSKKLAKELQFDENGKPKLVK